MTSMRKTLLLGALMASLGISASALAGPPAHAGGPGEQGGPPFGENFNPGGGPPAFAGNGGNRGGDEEEENGAAGGLGNGPPGLCGVEGEGPEGRAGRSHVAHLNFSQRDSEGEPVDDGAWGRMKYVWSGPTFDFVFNGHELPAGEEFEMTYQPESGEGDGAICLGGGTVNDEGDLHIANVIELNGNLPMPEDENDGALLVVVLSADVDCSTDEMLTFLAEDYLFGNALIQYVDTDFEEEEEEEGEESGS